MTGSLHFFKGNIPGATAWFQKALKIFDEIGYKLGRVLIYNNLGVMYRLLSNNNEAIKNFLIALELKKEMGDKKGANNARLDQSSPEQPYHLTLLIFNRVRWSIKIGRIRSA